MENVVSRPGLPSHGFWQGKRVLLTGHTGFKGAWLSIWLSAMGAKVTGVALAPDTDPALFTLAGVDALVDSRLADIGERGPLRRIVAEADPEAVFHLAAQSLVRTSYKEPLDTFRTNVMGTAHLLDALREAKSARSVVVVTTDKVYRAREWAYPYRESDHLGGHDPYSASKAAAEIVTASYRDAFLAARGVSVATARAGNVIGGGDWAADRLIPDAVRAWLMGEPLVIRRPAAVRPWQHVLEPLAGYLVLAERLWTTPSLAQAFNFGPETGQAATVEQVVSLARESFGQGETVFQHEPDGPHETTRLTLETAKACQLLSVTPWLDLGRSVRWTMDWYRRQAGGESALDLCRGDIERFEAGT